MQLITPTKPLLAGLMLLAATQAHAKLTSYTVNGTDLVYSSESNVTWTKDANLLGTMFASKGFDSVVNAILAASPTINNTSNRYSPTGTYTLTANDFKISGQASWFGAIAYVSYLNSISYGGSNQWYLPIVVNTTIGFNTSTNGTTKGDELVELFYQELNGIANNNIPNLIIFDNEQPRAYWSGNEVAQDFEDVWAFGAGFGYQGNESKNRQFYIWAVSPGQIAAVPEPESVAMLLAGLGLIGGVVRRRRG